MRQLPGRLRAARPARLKLTMCVNCRNCIGIRCKDGVVLGVENVLQSKLLTKNANRRIANIDRHVGLVRFPSFPCRVCPNVPSSYSN